MIGKILQRQFMNILNKILNHLKYKAWLYTNVIIPQFYFSLRLGKTIHAGPFKGLIYNLHSIGSVLTPKLIGTYEHELNEYFTSGFLNNYERFIDIGAAEGYYVVGARSLNKKMDLIAFETEFIGQQKIKENLLINRLWDEDKIKILGNCNHETLNLLLSSKKKTFILCDIEGYEKILLDLNEIPHLSLCDIVIEVHHDVNIGIEEILINRFSHTHDVSKLGKLDKARLMNKYKDSFILNNFKYLSNEFRKNESWLFFKVK